MVLPAHALFARAIKKLKQQAVADRLACSTAMVSLMKDNKKKPGLELATNIEREYGIPARLWHQPEQRKKRSAA